jgi:putative FmdB family regulatory protein
MPVYDFKCRACGHEFDALVRLGEVPSCPSCDGRDLERLVSLPAVSTEATRKRSFGKARQAAAAEHREKQHAQAEYERNYIKDHS